MAAVDSFRVETIVSEKDVLSALAPEDSSQLSAQLSEAIGEWPNEIGVGTAYLRRDEN